MPAHRVGRLAFLNVFRLRFPQDLGQARLALWMMKEDIYEAVHAHVQSAGREFADDRDMYVSPVLNALLSSGATLGDTPAEFQNAEGPVPESSDITDDEMLEIFEDVLRTQPTARFPIGRPR